MKIYVVTEGEFDSHILEVLLAHRFDPGQLVFVSAGGKSSASSLTRSLLARRHEPVALVLDADAVDDEVVAEQRSNLSTSLGLVGSPDMWTVLLFKPTLEVVLLRDPEIVQKLFRRQLKPHEEELAHLAPRKILETLIREAGYKSRERLVTIIDEQIAERLLEAPELAALVTFAARHLEQELDPKDGIKSSTASPSGVG